MPTHAFDSQEDGAKVEPSTGASVHSPDDKARSDTSTRERSRSSIQIYFGGRSFRDEALWAPVEGQFVMGSEFDWIAAGSVFGFEIGAQASFASEDQTVGSVTIDQGASSSELYVGPRFDSALFGSALHLVAGVGPSFLTAGRSQEINGSRRSGSAESFGIYAHAGLIVDLGDIGLGLDYRLRGGGDMTGFEDVFGSSITGDADYGQLALTFALQF